MAEASKTGVLHLFESDLENKVSGNSNKPPRSISAKALDGNFMALTLVAPDDNSYTANIASSGTTLKIFPPIPAGGTYFLGVSNGIIQWISGSGSPIGSP
jgi:hypothetical protein